MKIAFLILNLNSGGAERATSSLANYFALCGHDVSIITIDGTPSFYPLDKKVNTFYLDLKRLPKGSGFSRLRAEAQRALSLRKCVQKLKPDVLIGMSNIMTAYTVFCTIFSRIKSVGTERNNPYIYMATPTMTILRKLSCILCNGFIHQTKRAQEFFPSITYNKSSVIPNAVFNPLVSQVAPCIKGDKTIMAMGRLVRDKGFDILINAFSMIEKEMPDYKLIIFGNGELRDELLETAERLNIRGRVLLPGVRDDALFEVAKSSLFVLSSRNEGMPNVLMEAMACGVPCVATRCPMGPEELIIDGENGLLVPVEDEKALAEAMLRVLNNKAFANKLSEQSKRIKETHSIENIGNKWIEYLKTVIR